MRTRQGYRLPQQTIARIQGLLAETDMTIGEIAERLGHSKAVVSSINRKFEIRNYTGRSYWRVSENWTLEVRAS